jgi:quercetin dioxygenase-like cupin family protein
LELIYIDDVEGEKLGESGVIHKNLITSGERMICFLYKLPPGGGVAPHSHPVECVMYCLDGEVEITVAGEKATVKKGNVWLLPFNTEIGTKVISNTSAEILCVSSPNYMRK